MAESIDIRELNIRIEQQSAFVTNLVTGMDRVIVGQKHLKMMKRPKMMMKRLKKMNHWISGRRWMSVSRLAHIVFSVLTL